MHWLRQIFVCCSAILVHFVTLVLGNTEKVIFVAPQSVSLPQDAAIDNLLLHSLHSGRLSLRTHLNSSFPANDKPHGDETWLLLASLNPGQRYEVRVCWLATQPTAFWLDTYTIQEALDNPELITSLTLYSYARHDILSESEIAALQASRFKNGQADTALLFLRIQAAADYFTLNKTLMEHVPPVHVDLILDPYLLSILPQSLMPTAGYIVVIALIAWFLSGWAHRRLVMHARANSTPGGARALPESKKSR